MARARFQSQLVLCISGFSEVKVIECSDNVDQTSTWNKQLEEKLDKLNQDCNLMAGLESKLELAEGARVMLCRNIDT